MKVGQQTIVRWISKQVAKAGEPRQASVTTLRELSVDQLRHVSGGNTSTQLPRGGW